MRADYLLFAVMQCAFVLDAKERCKQWYFSFAQPFAMCAHLRAVTHRSLSSVAIFPIPSTITSERKKNIFSIGNSTFSSLRFFHPKNVFDFNRADCRLHPNHQDTQTMNHKIFYIVCSLLVIANPLDNFITIKIQRKKSDLRARAANYKIKQ